MSRWRTLLRPTIASFIITLVLVVMWQLNLFSQVQLGLTNIYYVDAPVSDHIVIVSLDDASFADYGRSPTQWSRTLYADMVKTVSEGGARVVAFDLIFSEPSPFDEQFADALRNARNSDARTRFVFATAGVNAPTALTSNFGYQFGLQYDSVLSPTALIKEEADYLGFVNAFPDSDSRLRRQVSLVGYDETIGLSFSMASYLAYLRVPSLALSQVVTQTNDALMLTAERAIPIDENGFWRQNYFGQPTSPSVKTFPVVSLRDVVNGNVDPIIFNDKIVFVGIINSTGVTDQYLVPVSNQPMAGIEIQANALETLIQNIPLREQSTTWQFLVILVFASASTLIYYAVNWRIKVGLVLVFVVAYVAYASFQFTLSHEIYNLLYPILALVVPWVVVAALNISDDIARRIRAETATLYLEELNRKTEAEKRLLEELNAKTEAEKNTLKDLNELKTRMIRMASHDLKNPLGRVFGYAELLLMDEVPIEQRTFIERIKQAGEEMNSLITEILDLEQLRSGNLQKQPILLNQLVREVVSRHEPDMVRKGQTYTNRISEDPVMVLGDTRQLSQAVSNLVGNAVKYTPDNGMITVTLVVKDGMAHLNITDTGYGMPQEALPKLFTEFYRVKTHATANIAGTGLGLSLVKSVVEAHAGTISVQSVEGKGSTFFVTIPLMEDAPILATA